MTARQIVSREEWLQARKALLVKEKEATRRRDELTAERMRLPMVKVEKEYAFHGPSGRQSLADLFAGQSQLIIYHFMFQPDWSEGCKSCSCFLDTCVGAAAHVRARDTAFAVVSLAPFEKIDQFRRRMGWNVTWVSSFGSDFNRDFEVSVDIADDSSNYNYARSMDLFGAGKIWFPKGEMPGMSAFLREGADIYHTYSVYQRGLDQFMNVYNLLDVTALGRHEEDAPGQSWIRHHDRYPA
jgi:predicted dithiol-disulfide oxidoreductase (DUF899 family)